MESKVAAEQTQVIIVGGGLVGLSAAMFLAWRGVETVLVEQHSSSSLHPRAIGFTSRTLELFRSVGIIDRIPQVQKRVHVRRRRVESLAGKWMDESHWTPQQQQQQQQQEQHQKKGEEQEKKELSPHLGAAIAQDTLEPILRARAIELGADIRQSTQMLHFEQDEEGVTIWVKNKVTNDEYSIRAPYMIGADGHRSKVREGLEIERKGRGHMKTLRSALFRADLQEYLKDGVIQFEIRQPDLEAFLTTYNDGRWVLMMDDKERTIEESREMIYRSIGRRDIEVEMITTGCWELSAWIVDSYSKGRVFLAGDAAHTLPPSRGGYGANTGIEDVQNLSWKLQSVLNGSSSPSLLSTYDEERRPIGWLRHDQIFARPDYKHMAEKDKKETTIIEDDAMELGQLYRSSVIIGGEREGEVLPPALRPDQWAGQPGTRAPHLPISIHDEELRAKLPSSISQPSTLDLFQHSWVLLSQNDKWKVANSEVLEKLGVRVKFVHVGKDVEVKEEKREEGEDGFSKALGVAKDGAVLIRPDGYIAWRYEGEKDDKEKKDEKEALADALRQVASLIKA